MSFTCKFIKNKNVRQKTELQSNLELKSIIKQFIKNTNCKLGKSIAQGVLFNLEKIISDEISDKNAQIVEDQLKDISGTDGKLSQNGMWNMKKKLFPRK